MYKVWQKNVTKSKSLQVRNKERNYIYICILLGLIHSLQNHRPAVHRIQSSAKDMRSKIANPLQKSQFNEAKCMCVHSMQKMSDLQVTMWSSSSDGSSLNPDTNFQFLVKKSKETCMHVQTLAL
jgi:hypothetical protein